MCFASDSYSLVKTPLDVRVGLEGMSLSAVTFLLSPMSDMPRGSFKHLDCLCGFAHLLRVCLGSVPQLGFPTLQHQAKTSKLDISGVPYMWPKTLKPVGLKKSWCGTSLGSFQSPSIKCILLLQHHCTVRDKNCGRPEFMDIFLSESAIVWAEEWMKASRNVISGRVVNPVKSVSHNVASSSHSAGAGHSQQLRWVGRTMS